MKIRYDQGVFRSYAAIHGGYSTLKMSPAGGLAGRIAEGKTSI